MPLYWPQPWLLYVKPTKSNLTLLCNLQYIGESKHRLKDRSVTPKPQFQNTFSAIATLFPICYLSQLIYLDMNYRASGNEQTWRTIIIMYNLYLFFGLLFFAATPYRIIPCNFRLLFYSSMYSVYSWFFLINLMKTGIGHLHDGVISLLWPGSFRVLLSCSNYGFCYLNLTGATKVKYEKKNEKNSGRSSKMTPSCKWPIGQSKYCVP